MMGNTPIMICRESAEIVHSESNDLVPQWVYIHGMTPGMFAKEAVNAFTSILGITLHAEFIDTVRHLHYI